MEQKSRKGEEMKIECPKCGAKGQTDAMKIPESGAMIRCPNCRERFQVKKSPSSPNELASGQTIAGSASLNFARPQTFPSGSMETPSSSMTQIIADALPSNTLEIGPNKQMSLLVLLASIPLFLYGLYEFNSNPNSDWTILFLLSAKGWHLGIALMLVLPITIYNAYWAHTTQDRIIITRDGITLSEHGLVRWHEISDIKILNYTFLAIGVYIFRKDKSKLFIKWNQIDCGVSYFADTLLGYINK
jgi:predicted Zn finger-like uncharacterized protein